MKLLLISPHSAYATRRLEEEASAQGIRITLMDVADLTSLHNHYEDLLKDHDALYIRQGYQTFQRQAAVSNLDYIVKVAELFYKTGKILVDQGIAAGDIGKGKYEALRRLQTADVPISQSKLLGNIKSGQQRFPCVVKWIFGFSGNHVYLVNSQFELNELMQKYPINELLVQQFIPAETEYKVITVGYKSLPVIVKVKRNRKQLLPDLEHYELISSSQLSHVTAIAEQAARILHRELAKVDILESGGTFYVLEVNRWPGFQYFERVSKYNVASEFLRYIKSRAHTTNNIP